MEIRGELMPPAVSARLRSLLANKSDCHIARSIGISRTAFLRAAAGAHVFPRTRDAVLTYVERLNANECPADQDA